jgi:hypothetical protein
MGIVAKHQRMAFRNAHAEERLECVVNEPIANSMAAMQPRNGKVMDVPAPTIMATQHGSNQLPVFHCHEAKTGISRKEDTKRCWLIILAQANALRCLPQLERLRNVSVTEWCDALHDASWRLTFWLTRRRRA